MLMQEGSMHNANQLGLSMWDDVLEGGSWVLLRKEIEIYRLPTLGEKVRIITYPAGLNKVFAYRDFWVLDMEGKTLATASTTWVLMHLENRKMMRLPEPMKQIQEVQSGQYLPIPDLRLPMLDSLDHSYTYRIGHYDLDWNHHVNNIITAKLMLQSVSKETYDNQTLQRYTFIVKSEILAGEEIDVRMSEVNGKYHHQLSHADGSMIAYAISEWK